MLTPKKKITRHQMKEDKLVTTYLKINNFIGAHQREITYVVIGVVALLALGVFMLRSKREAETKASVELVKAKMEFTRQAYPAAIDILKKLVDNYDGTPSAGLGTIYLGQAYLKSQDYTNAAQAFQTYLDDYGGDDLLSSAAMAGLAASFDERKDYAKAAQLYEQVAEKYPGVVYAPKWLLDAARCHVNAGEKPAAQQALKKIIEKYPKTAVLEQAKSSLAELGT